jgi:hypothetical protein
MVLPSAQKLTKEKFLHRTNTHSNTSLMQVHSQSIFRLRYADPNGTKVWTESIELMTDNTALRIWFP